MSFAAMLAELLPAVDDVYNRWTAASQDMTAAFPTEMKITCKKGCGACCHFPVVPVTMGEAFVLFNHLLAAGYELSHLQVLFVTHYSQRYFALSRQLGALPFDQARVKRFMTELLPCPLFEKTPTPQNRFGGYCGAFSVRPLICDYFHSTDSPALCARHEPHGTLTLLINRGVEAVEELRAFERKHYGWSVLMHLPLAMAVLCTHAGLELVTTRRCQAAENEEEQGIKEFEIFVELVGLLGYQVGENDLQALALAQQALSEG